MNTSKQILLMLGIAIAVVAACDFNVGQAPENAQPESLLAPDVVSSRPSEDFVGVWTIMEIENCPPTPPAQHYKYFPERFDRYAIFERINGTFGIRALTGLGMDGWADLVLEYDEGNPQKRPRGSEVNIGGKLNCGFGPHRDADRLHGCVITGKVEHCFDIDFVIISPFHDFKSAPYISYDHRVQHNGIIH